MRLLMLLLKLLLLLLILLTTLGVIGLGVGFVYLEQRGKNPIALVKEVKDNPKKALQQLKAGVQEVSWRERAEQALEGAQETFGKVADSVRGQFEYKDTPAPGPSPSKLETPAPPPQPKAPSQATPPPTPTQKLPEPPADIVQQLRKIFPEMSDRQIREAYRRNQLMGQTE